MEKSLSNWGRWGKEDERGTLNLVTPEKTKQALALVKDGVVVSLARFASLEKAVDNFNFGETQHEMWYGAAGPPKPGQRECAVAARSPRPPRCGGDVQSASLRKEDAVERLHRGSPWTPG